MSSDILRKGDRVRIKNTGSSWDNRQGVIESINWNLPCPVYVTFGEDGRLPFSFGEVEKVPHEDKSLSEFVSTASATKSKEYRTRTIKEEVEVVTLTMSREEADALVDVIRKVAGHGEYTRRGLIENLERALHNAGVIRTNEDLKDVEGTVRFLGKGDTNHDPYGF